MIPENRSAATAGESIESAAGHPPRPVLKRALVVEDQALIALSLAADLAALGCDIVGRAASGEAAVELARRCAPHIVLMDVHLAGAMDGIEAAALIQAECGAHIVFITAFADGPDRSRMAALRPIAILGKPYDLDDLNLMLRASALHDRTQQPQLAAAAG